jgi:hypothetical protein
MYSGKIAVPPGGGGIVEYTRLCLVPKFFTLVRNRQLFTLDALYVISTVCDKTFITAQCSINEVNVIVFSFVMKNQYHNAA